MLADESLHTVVALSSGVLANQFFCRLLDISGNQDRKVSSEVSQELGLQPRPVKLTDDRIETIPPALDVAPSPGSNHLRHILERCRRKAEALLHRFLCSGRVARC